MLEPPTINYHQRSPSAPTFPRPEDLHFQIAYTLLLRRWGVTRTRRNHGVVHLLRALCSRPSFRSGKRVAWSTTKIAGVIKVEPRTVTTIIAKLRELPELVTIRTVRRGELRWDGRPARFAHLDWQHGPALQQRIADLASSSAAAPADLASVLPRSHVALPTDVASPDLALVPHAEKQLKAEPLASTDQLNFKDPAAGGTSSPTPPDADTHANPPPPTGKLVPEVDRYGAPPTTSSRHGGRHLPRAGLRPPRKARFQPPATELDVRGLAHPVQLLAAIIRTVLGRGDHLRLHPDEFYLVDGALRCVAGQYAPEAIPELVEQVLALALQDHARARAERRTSRDRPTLAYVFGGPDDAPHLPHRFFLDRVILIRERQLDAERHQRSEDHAQLGKLLWGGAEPPAQARRAATPCEPPQVVTPNWPLSAEEIDAALARVEESWQQPHRARAG